MNSLTAPGALRKIQDTFTHHDDSLIPCFIVTNRECQKAIKLGLPEKALKAFVADIGISATTLSILNLTAPNLSSDLERTMTTGAYGQYLETHHNAYNPRSSDFYESIRVLDHLVERVEAYDEVTKAADKGSKNKGSGKRADRGKDGSKRADKGKNVG